jgi:hypothetical protein
VLDECPRRPSLQTRADRGRDLSRIENKAHTRQQSSCTVVKECPTTGHFPHPKSCQDAMYPWRGKHHPQH